MGKAEGKEKDSSYILCHLFSQEDSSLWLTTKKSTVCLYMLINTKRSLICLFVNVLTFISMNCYCSFYRQGWCKCMGVFMQVEARGQSRRAFLQVHHLVFSDIVSPLTWSSGIQLGWLASRLQGITCLCLPSAGITSFQQLPPDPVFFLPSFLYIYVCPEG